MRLKVGDKIRVIDDEGYSKITNKIGILTEDDGSWRLYKVYFEDINENHWLREKQIKLAKLTKQELLDMPAGTIIYTDAEDEDKKIFVKVFENDMLFRSKKTYLSCDEITEDLEITDSRCGTKIIKIEQPTYKTVYESTEVQEMTVAEIEKALGHAVKIIKEDK